METTFSKSRIFFPTLAAWLATIVVGEYFKVSLSPPSPVWILCSSAPAYSTAENGTRERLASPFPAASPNSSPKMGTLAIGEPLIIPRAASLEMVALRRSAFSRFNRSLRLSPLGFRPCSARRSSTFIAEYIFTPRPTGVRPVPSFGGAML